MTVGCKTKEAIFFYLFLALGDPWLEQSPTTWLREDCGKLERIVRMIKGLEKMTFEEKERLQ